jgi:hypothetical protein
MNTIPTVTASGITTAIAAVATSAATGTKDTETARTVMPARKHSGRLSLCARLL